MTRRFVLFDVDDCGAGCGGPGRYEEYSVFVSSSWANSLGGGIGGGGALGMSVDLREDLPPEGGGGTSRGSFDVKGLGKGGGALTGGLVNSGEVFCSSKVSSSKLESRPWDLSASLCFALEAMSVS
jgi:hypothetical protein